MKTKSKLLPLAILLLAACATSPEQIASRVSNVCRGYGFQPGTDAYRNCLMTTEQSYLSRVPAGCVLIGDSGDAMVCQPRL